MARLLWTLCVEESVLSAGSIEEKDGDEYSGDFGEDGYNSPYA